MPERNLLDELMKLLSQPGGVNWALASQLADHLSGPSDPIDPWLAEEYLELIRFAQLRVSQTGMPVDPMAENLLLDKKGWTSHNLRSFSYLVEPLATKLDVSTGSGPLDGVMKPLGSAMLGMQMGAMVKMMSERVLGLFDTGLPTARPAALTFLVSNIESFASEHALDPRQVRLWTALHEVVHSTLVGRSWVRPHLIQLFDDLTGSMEMDTGAILGWQENLADPAKLEELFSQEQGFSSLFSGPLQDWSLESIKNLMAMLEGLGTCLVERAGSDLLPDLHSIRTAMSAHIHSPDLGLHGLFELETGAGGYGSGAAFCAEIADRWGDDAMLRIWEGPENLPVTEELQDATGWAARVLLNDQFTL